MTNELRGRGFQAHTVVGGDYHRVVVGPFSAESEALSGLARLRGEGYKGYLRNDLQLRARTATANPRIAAAPRSVVAEPPSITAPPEPRRVVERFSGELFTQPIAPPSRASLSAELPAETIDANLTARELVPVEPLLLALAPPPAPIPAPAPEPEPEPPIIRAGLQILVLAGEGAVNNVKKGIARDPAVQVVDRNDRPLAGAVLVFSLPERGPSGLFANGSRTMIVRSGDDGTASTVGFRPNGVEGELPIQVTASFEGQKATTTIRQTNLVASGGVPTGAKMAIVAAIAAGAAVGIVRALDNDGTPTLPPIRATASVGSPTVGQP